jgi:large subunit ribosomal protein L4
MKAAALRGALSDRARGGKLHIVSGFVAGEAPSTKSALGVLADIASSRHVLVVAERTDVQTWKSLRNVDTVHLIAPGQLNTYDVLVSDDVIFTQGALEEFLTRTGTPAEVVAAPVEAAPAKKAAAKKAPAKKVSPEPSDAELAATETDELEPSADATPEED